MAEKSFSRKAKDVLSELSPKKGCCRKTEKYLKESLLPPADFKKAKRAGEKALCRECTATFLRIVFTEFGTVTDPAKSYHLEMSFPDEEFRDFVKDMLENHGLFAKCGKRRSKFTVYFKDSVAIEDFFATVGASGISFDMMNLKLVKEVRNGINRQNNFETSNMQKTASAVIPFVHAIEYLTENGYIGSMTEELRETARLRVENDTASMAVLAKLHNPPISKSGVKHRLDKIMELYCIARKSAVKKINKA